MQLSVETSDEVSMMDAAAMERRPQSSRPVDLVHLARYTLGNRSLEREVLELFGVQSRLYLQRLKDAVSDKAWHEAAHTIKGSARGIGAWRVARSAEAAEGLQGAALAEGRAAAVEALARAIEEANSYIRGLLVEG